MVTNITKVSKKCDDIYNKKELVVYIVIYLEGRGRKQYSQRGMSCR